MNEAGPGVFPTNQSDPYADDYTQPFWDAALEGRLVAPRCKECGTFRLPPGPFCFVCQHQEVDWIELPGTGTIYTYTVVRHALSPQLAEVVPYVTAVIELDGATGAGSRMIANVVDCDPESVAIGDRVRIAWDRVSDTLALPRFAPE
jgi:uncharacterized OB-fold protein